jgi:hypothetical protein
MFEEVKVYFWDGTTTLFWLSEDDNMGDAVVALCDSEGWPMDDVKAFHLTGNKTEIPTPQAQGRTPKEAK